MLRKEEVSIEEGKSGSNKGQVMMVVVAQKFIHNPVQLSALH